MRAGPDAFAPLMPGMFAGAGGDTRDDDDDDNRSGRRFRAIFVSDIHLGTAGCQAQALLSFLKAHPSDTLYLVADEREGGMPAPKVVKIVKFSKSGNHRATVRKVKVFGNERVTAGGQIKRVKPKMVSSKKKAGSAD